jgi:hypothetical protein
LQFYLPTTNYGVCPLVLMLFRLAWCSCTQTTDAQAPLLVLKKQQERHRYEKH